MRNLMILIMFLLGTCLVNPVFGEEAAVDGDAPKKEKKEKKVKKPKAPLVDISVTGKITKKEKKDKKGNVKVSYCLTDEAGTSITLPKQKKSKKLPKPGKTVPVVYDYETFIDAKVVVTGKGTSKENKGKKRISIKKIVSIEKVVE